MMFLHEKPCLEIMVHACSHGIGVTGCDIYEFEESLSYRVCFISGYNVEMLFQKKIILGFTHTETRHIYVYIFVYIYVYICYIYNFMV